MVWWTPHLLGIPPPPQNKVADDVRELHLVNDGPHVSRRAVFAVVPHMHPVAVREGHRELRARRAIVAVFGVAFWRGRAVVRVGLNDVHLGRIPSHASVAPIAVTAAFLAQRGMRGEKRKAVRAAQAQLTTRKLRGMMPKGRGNTHHAGMGLRRQAEP